MKKKVFILLSTILCSLVTVSLVTLTLIGIFGNKTNSTAPENPPTVDVNINQGNLTNDNLTLNLIVGDEYTGGVLTAENYTGTLFVANSNGVLVASTAGSETISVQNGNVIYSCVINIFEKGDGSQQNPYNIVRAEDLITLVNSSNGYTYYAQRCDLDLTNFASWSPIGKLATPFIGSYNGNGYAIKNMSITVTQSNVGDYIDYAQAVNGANGSMLTVGFFGFVGDPLANSISEILNISMIDAKVDTTAIEANPSDAVSIDNRDALNLTHSYVGVVAGFVANSEIKNTTGNIALISSTINSSLNADDSTSTRGAVSAFVGGATGSTLSGYTIKSDITAKNSGTVEKTAKGPILYGTTIAGILGRNTDTNLEDFVVELSVSARNYENIKIAGAVGNVVKSSSATPISIKDIEINNLYVKLGTYTYTKAGIVAGVVAYVLDSDTVIENVQVNNILVEGIGSAQASGVANTNYGTIKNVTVTGLIKGSVVAGFAYTNYGSICFDDTLSSTYALDATLRGQTKIAGVAIYNYGTISGSSSLTQIKAELRWNIIKKDFDAYEDEFMIAGIAVVSAGANSRIENIYTLTNIIDAVNAAGAVGHFGYYNGYDGGTIKNCVINTTIRTIAGKVGITPYSGKSNVIGGVVANVGKDCSGSLIEDVSGAITVNNTKVQGFRNDVLYGLNVYGTIVGLCEGKVTINSTNTLNNISAVVYTNYCVGNQYIGYVVGKVATTGSVTVGKTVKVIILPLAVANGAIEGEVNKA